jgi:hypothetical protein
MKKYFSVAVTALFVTVAVSFAGPDKAAMEAKENAAWQAYKDKKADAFQKVVDKDVKCVYAEGIADMQKELTDMKTADLKSFAITDFTMFTDEPDVVVATYTVKVEGSGGGQDMTGTYNAGTVWKQEKGEWLAIFHTHSKQAAAAAAK